MASKKRADIVMDEECHGSKGLTSSQRSQLVERHLSGCEAGRDVAWLSIVMG